MAYRLVYCPCEENIVLDIPMELMALKRQALLGELQYFDHSSVKCSVSKNGGIELPQFMIQEGFTFFSDKIKNCFEQHNVENVFWKKIIIQGVPGYDEVIYWLGIIPRIDCLKSSCFSDSDDSTWNCADGVYPMLSTYSIVLNPKAFGNYSIFRVAGLAFSEDCICVTDKFHDMLSRWGMDEMNFIEM